jgi:hypothetical protein
MDDFAQNPQKNDGEFSSGLPHEFFDRLERRIEATKAIRFQATDRLVRRHKLSAYNDKDARASIEEISNEYEAIIENSRVNHAECDYIRIRARRPGWFGVTSPQAPRTFTGKAALNCARLMDWGQSILREYIWLFLPLIFTMFASYMIYLMIAYNWPRMAS